MGHTLVLDIPENVYQPLMETAKQTGRTPEDLAAEWLKMIAQSTADDPIEDFIGAFRSNQPDWANQHDRYLGETLLHEMQNGKDTP